MATQAKKKRAAKRGPTPMMAQYLALKDRVPDCLLFYRMGDFFELFFDDAKQAAATLDIALTARGEHDGEPIPMCGVPAHSHEAYLARLIKAGHRVAIADQTETPEDAKKRAGSKALVERAIIRVVTAGTLTEETLLDARAENWLVAVCETGGRLGIAAADISTGRFVLSSAVPDMLDAELARLSAAELIVPDSFAAAPNHAQHCPKTDFSSIAAEKRLKALFGVATLDGFGDFDRAELAAAGGLLAYLETAGQGSLPFLQAPRRHRDGDHMLIDAATRESLELTMAASGGRTGSLLGCIDRTVTGAGARLLASDIAAPLTELDAITARLDLVQLFEGDAGGREKLRADLKALPDIGRALGRLVAGRGAPRDLGLLRDGLSAARDLHIRLSKIEAAPTLLTALLPSLTGHGALTDRLSRALVSEPPIDPAKGGYIAEGYDAALDDLRETAGVGRKAIAGLEARYREVTGIQSLKVKHNNVLGYHIEVPAKHADALMGVDSGFTHRQTLAGVVRFNAPDLHEEAQRVMQAGAHALAAEAAHLEDLIATTLADRDRIAATADALARLDVAAALAEQAVLCVWTRPRLADHACFRVEGGRHPVVEQAVERQGERFIANDCFLGLSDDSADNSSGGEAKQDSRLWLVTGPNMGGKSTFLRQNALIAVLAQAGSYVPADDAELGIVDKLFSRVGASDNLARGRSTFMVEMVETAAILAQATENSLVILDEVGRGTSTYDGLAIAWAVVETVHDANQCRCLFATHYHELTRLAERLDALSLHHVRAREWKGDLLLLHELADGPADRSYGLAVAKLAGLPKNTLIRAKAVLAKLEAGRASTGGLAAGLDDLPLFTADVTQDEAKPDLLREALEAIHADDLSPREALDLVYRLKRLAQEADDA